MEFGIRLGGHAHGIVTKNVHKTHSMGGVVGERGSMGGRGCGDI